jgi:hypothetical protein
VSTTEELHERIGKALGWSEQDVRSMSLTALESVVRAVDAQLARDIMQHREEGSHLLIPHKPKRRH